MEDNFDEELRQRYINEYKVDIEYLGVDELLGKGKTFSKKQKLIYHRAALEKLTKSVQQEYKPRTIRRVTMESLLANFIKTGSMQIVWKAYLLHVEKNIDLPVEFQRRLQEEMVKIAESALGENGQKFTKAQINRLAGYRAILDRSKILLRLIDKGLETGIHKAYLHISDECMDKENPLFDPSMNETRLKGLYRGFYSEHQIRPPKKLAKKD